jgi:uncharacterized protein involved in outer membrane biogenesis
MKLILRLAFFFLLLVVGVVVGVGVLLDPAAAKAVSAGVTAATGCESTLGEAEIGLIDGNVRFAELEVANPPGFREGSLLTLGDLNASWETPSLFTDEIHVKQLELDGLVLSLQLQGAKTNLDPIIAKLRELASKGGESQPAGESEPSAGGEAEGDDAGPKVLIDRVRIAGIRTELSVAGVPGIEGDYGVDVPEFVINDLGNGENAGSVSEWSARILEVLLEQTQAAGQGTFPAQWQELLGGNLDQLKESALKQLEAEAKDLLEEHADELPEELQKGLDSLKKDAGGLFGGK